MVTRDELEVIWNERADRALRGVANVAGFGIDMRGSLKRTEAIQVFVLMESIELQFVPTTRAFTARTSDVVYSMLRSLVFLEGA